MYRRFVSCCRPVSVLLVLVLTIGVYGLIPLSGLAAGDITLVIDGERVNASPLPLIRDGRTLVPVRLISEKLGASVEWNGQDRTVYIAKGNRWVRLRIDSRLVEYNDGKRFFDLSDVPPQIIEDRTFVPIRLVSNALGVGVTWEDSSRTVYVDSSRSVKVIPFFDMNISSVKPGQVISGTTELQASVPRTVSEGAAEIRYLLLDAGTGRGVVVARGNDITAKYNWLPDLRQNGERVLVAAVYDRDGGFVCGDAIPVQVKVVPEVSLTGLKKGQIIRDTISLGADLNFVASYVKYEIVNRDKGRTFVSEEADPQGAYTWTPMLEDNGKVSFRVIAYDQSGQAYASQAVTAKVDAARKLELRGVKAGSTVDKPVTLWVSRNFQVSQTEYVMLDPGTGEEQVLAQVGYTSYRWFPGPEQVGIKELMVRVKDTSGITHTSDRVAVTLTGAPSLILQGVAPQQVVTGPLKLTVSSNVLLDGIQYVLINPKTGARRVVAGGEDSLAEYVWTPTQADDGEWSIQAEGTYASGTKIVSQAVPFKVYTGKVYPALPIVEKSKFLDLASGLARSSWQKTGMSAALQTAQAILETGWGQSVPVDKYTGKLSYNLFGIKGTGPAGSIISNTWEEYNGTIFRVDANFRAYNSVAESWEDHKNLLLTASRYQPFRAVMHDSTQGAWALKRAGYATDSKYPIKLMNIIQSYGLSRLDEVGI